MTGYATALGPGKTQRGTSRLRVLMVCTRYLPDMGGVETHVCEVTRRLSAMDGFEITVLATDRTRSLPGKEVIKGIDVLRVPSWPRNRDYYLAPKIAAVVGQPDRWDLVHCQGIHSPVPVLAMLAARRAKIPYVVTFHTGGHSLRLRNSLRPLQWWLIGPLLRDAAALVGVSRFETDTLSRQARLRGKPVTVIRNGGTLPPPAAPTAAVPGRIVSSGRLERYKGHHRVIECLPYLIRDVPDAHLVVLGEGPYESELRKLAGRLGVLDRVIIKRVAPGDRQAMATELAAASVVVSLSEYEAYGVGLMEAISAGRPVVGYDVTGVAELVAEGWVHGVSPGEPAVSVARHLAAAMSARSLAAPKSLPTWDACAEQLRDIYLTLVNRSGSAAPGTPAVPDTAAVLDAPAVLGSAVLDAPAVLDSAVLDAPAVLDSAVLDTPAVADTREG